MPNITPHFTSDLVELIDTLERSRDLIPAVHDAAVQLTEALQKGNKILTAGNGGSAADALHMAEELMGRFERERRPLPAVCLNADPTLLTCIGNDYGYGSTFSRQVKGLGVSGDILVVFSTSGNSDNIIEAIKQGARSNLKTIALLGKSGGAAKHLSNTAIVVPSKSTARVQEIHTLIIHMWLRFIESHFV